LKLATYKINGEPRIGLVVGDKVADLAAAYVAMANKQDFDLESIPTDMASFLALEKAMEIVRQVETQLVQAVCWSKDVTYPLDKVTLMAPILRPGKIICIGLNYIDHAKEGGHPLPKEPVIFGKFANAVIGPEDAIRCPDPAVSDAIDYEAELAVVIGKRAYRVDKTTALDYVAGYLNFNDISARDLQHRDGQWMKGKFLDTFAPMGPWLVTKEEIADPGNLKIQLRLNGQVMQSSNTGNLIFDVPHLVSYLSSLVTLEPGDIIATGTPSGVGFVRKPPVLLKPGDVVEVEIEGLGVLRNHVIQG
jgi:2-keto-4-pentenoate hydratase/2-oxohepta-3-ene-1,7-dioic acid hydratase in catechol pathway